MRKITIIVNVLFAVGTTGCASMCRDTVTINHAAASLSVSPPVANVCRGDTISVRVVPPGPAASTAPKPNNPDWVMGSVEQGGDAISLMVPEDEDVGALREYTVEVEGVGMLDPTFRVAN